LKFSYLKKFLLALFLISPTIAFASEVTPLKSETVTSLPPLNSWEAWMRAMMNGGKGGLPGRPDGKKINEELPVWVDCFLSHYIDQPQSKKNALLSKLVLKAHSKLCIGSLSEWAE
jgi:hypothetical protein